jgi:glycosyltransferase involved in cell wall biosynthesis
VVVPVRNGRKTVPQCLEGLLRQSLRPQVIYVVDNGSTDGTHEWLQEFAVQEPSLRVLREARRGPAAAHNIGTQGAMTESGTRDPFRLG